MDNMRKDIAKIRVINKGKTIFYKKVTFFQKKDR